MNIEYEVRVLEINKEELVKKLESFNAEFKGEFNQKRYVYNTIPKQDNCWLRLRTNGHITTLTYKSFKKDTIDGTNELEVKIEDFEKTKEILDNTGLKPKGYQENNRVQYVLDGVEIDIDSWPMIPTYVEIEGKDEKSVNDIIEKLNLDKSKVTALDVQSVYKKFYGIDISKIEILKF